MIAHHDGHATIDYMPIDPVLRGDQYRKEGWNGFDPEAPPYQPRGPSSTI